MDDFRMDTGDVFADHEIEKKLAESPEYWALINYLEYKGILDRAEFFEFLSNRCTQYVKTVKAAHCWSNDQV